MTDHRRRTLEVHGRAAIRERVEGATFTRLGPDGLVVEDVHHTDLAGLMRQLG